MKAEKRTDKFIVSFDEADDIAVSTVQIADFGLYSGRELTNDEYQELKSALGLASCKARAMRILGSVTLSEREMERRLISKGEAAEDARAAVEWLKEIGMIDDTRYAASITGHYSGKGYGPARIKDELFKRGIPRGISEEAMSGVENDYEAAEEYIAKKLKGSTEKEDVRSAVNALYRRGFSYDDARAAVSGYMERTAAEGNIKADDT